MTGTLRGRKILLALLVLAVVAASLGPGSASAFRKIHHADPVKVFAKYKSAPRKARASAFASAFATTWPCDPVTDDRPPIISANAPQVKAIYAYPAGDDNFGVVKDLIQADAQAVRDRLSNGEDTSKTIRFDTGGTGGACVDPKSYLDIQKVALNSARATYNNGQTFRTLTNELKSKLPAPAPGVRVNYVVYAERIQAPLASGEADIPLDDSHDPLNAVNQGQNGDGRLFAVVYGNPANGTNFNGIADATAAESVRRATFLHELSHNLGAVQDSAPNSSHAGHCLDEQDIMCYDDAGPGTPAIVCAGGADFTEKYDCNRDDYFNPNPPAGSYLATHWNVFDSVFLCDVSECDTQLSPPPAITFGTTHVGGRLTFIAAPASGSIAHYEWDIDGDRIYDVDTGTTPSITPDFTFVTPRTVRVRASKADGTFAFDSATVTPAVPSARFSISGKFAVGETLQLDGTATQDPDGLIQRFLWDLDGDGIYETDTGLNRTVTTSFAAPGSVSVGLKVEFPLGFSSSRTDPFSIASAAAIPAPPGGGSAPVITAPPGPSFSVAALKLGKLISGGLPLRITCGAPCSVRFTLSVDAKAAKKLKLKSKAGKPVVIGRLTGTFADGTTKPKLQLTAAAKKALKKARSLKATLAGSVRQGSQTPLKVSKALGFKR